MSTDAAILIRRLSRVLFTRLTGAAADVEKLLNKESGVLGMSGVSGDIRDVFIRCKRRKGEGKRSFLMLYRFIYGE